MHENLDKFITILEKVISGKNNLNGVESELLNISTILKTNLSELNKDDLDLSKKINKIENLILEIEKKFKKSSILLEEFKKFIEQKNKNH